MRFGDQLIFRKPTQTLQESNVLQKGLDSLCSVGRIPSKQKRARSVVEIVYALVAMKYAVYLKTIFLTCTLLFLEDLDLFGFMVVVKTSRRDYISGGFQVHFKH